MDAGIELGVVLGGGNLFRGAALSEAGMDRVVGDRMGMLATIMNALALGDFLSREGIANQVFTATGIPGIAPAYERDQALSAMKQGKVLILSERAGNPLFTTRIQRPVCAGSNCARMQCLRPPMSTAYTLRIRRKIPQQPVSRASLSIRYYSSNLASWI